MANSMPPQNTAEKNAQKYFKKADQSDTLAKQGRKKERAADAAKTARLRGLRLAKEQTDKQEADRLAEESGTPAGAQPRRSKRAAKPAPMKRLTY